MSNNELALLNSIDGMAKAFATSGMFGQSRPEAWASLMFIAHAEGRHPATVAKEYHFIDNKPSLRSETMLARFQASGGKITWLESTDKRVSGTFSHPQGGELTIEWTMERAAKAGLATKAQWLKYPQQMMRARAVSEGVRALYPVVLNGMYTPEEVADFEPLAAAIKPTIKQLDAVEFDTLIGQIINATANEKEELINVLQHVCKELASEQQASLLRLAFKHNRAIHQKPVADDAIVVEQETVEE